VFFFYSAPNLLSWSAAGVLAAAVLYRFAQHYVPGRRHAFLPIDTS